MNSSLKTYADNITKKAKDSLHEIQVSGIPPVVENTKKKEKDARHRFTEEGLEKTVNVLVGLFLATKIVAVLRSVFCMSVYSSGGTPEQRWIKLLLAMTIGPLNTFYRPPGYCSPTTPPQTDDGRGDE